MQSPPMHGPMLVWEQSGDRAYETIETYEGHQHFVGCVTTERAPPTCECAILCERWSAGRIKPFEPLSCRAAVRGLPGRRGRVGFER